jgi:hypothetical protein
VVQKNAPKKIPGAFVTGYVKPDLELHGQFPIEVDVVALVGIDIPVTRDEVAKMYTKV